MPDRAEAILLPVKVADRVKAAAWDAFDQSRDADDLAARLKGMPLPDDVKAALWDAKNAPEEPPNGPIEQAARAATHIGPITWADRVANTLPTVGGVVGGLVGGIGGSAFGLGVGGVPGAVGGATLGGAAGESYKQLFNRARGKYSPPTPLKAAGNIALQGAEQGAAELTGQGLMRAARPVGKAMIENAVRPPISLQREFPDIIDTIADERLPVGRALPGMAKGSEQAAAKRRASGADTTRILTEATNAGLRVPAGDVARPVADLAADITKQPLSDTEIAQVSGMLAEFFKNKPAAFTPLQVKELKQMAQKIAQPIFKAQAAGNVPGPEQAVKGRFSGAIAEGSKNALENMPQGFGRRVATSEARTQRLIGAQKAIRQAEMRRLPLWAELASAGAGSAAGAMSGDDLKGGMERGGGTYLLIRALSSPRTLSRMGLVLTSRSVAQALRQMPRAAVLAALNEATADTQTER